ncbi:hypothetical protein Q9L58_001937 [Maublancomyces gigas]|uniref:F-box domain-containing protein n=1 Tax=Discina gigas TaxID=1032678 RepID=A0ABR3GTC1_9PEZI
MATLNTLPYETLTQILSGLSNADLAHISCVSSRLCAVAEPLLYKAPCLSETTMAGRQRSSLEIFLQTLLLPGRESLATYAKSLRVDRRRGSYRMYEHEVLDPSVLPRSSQSHGTELVSLLHLLSSIQVLHIAPANACSDFTRLMEPCDGALPSTLQLALRSLRIFRCASFNPMGMRAQTVLTLLRLPCIRSIWTPVNRENGFIMRAPIHTAAASSITDLRLSGSIPIASLSYLLRDLAALTHFGYDAYVSDDFDLQAFMAVLEPLRNSLQHLYLELTTDNEPYVELDDVFIGGSLRTWPVLRTLSCGLVPLLGKGKQDDSLRLVDVLPPSLRELEVLSDNYWLCREVLLEALDLVGKKESVVPNLECLAIVNPFGARSVYQERLAILCESLGVRYKEDCFCLLMWEGGE